MKRNLLLFTMTGFLMLLLSSCYKTVDAPGAPALNGRWYLQNAARYDGYKWQNIQTGYEDGTFIFKGNGDLVYTDAIGVLHGSWQLYGENGGYYDNVGIYRHGYHSVFSILLFEGNNNNAAADWIFDDNDYAGGNRFSAVYTAGNYTYEYSFVRE
ncbi:MAG TPA: hypothetical protein VL307_12430 [Chitinophagaceae bacterium]|nr:hypothetical protein [Chitinophagaceae bacterium]